MGIKHTKVSGIADGSNATQVRPSDWNDDHTIDGDVSFNGHDITNVGNLGEFTDLEDVPATYAGAGNKLVAVNAGATGLTFIEPSAGGPVDEFTDLLDVPGSYSGQAGKVATVNATEDALEFAESSTGVDWITPQQYGAVADGTSHPLSEFYGSLAAAQAAYDGAFYFVTSLTQEIDYAAVKAASNECFGADLDYDVANFAVNGAIGAVSGATTTIPGASFVANELIGQTFFIQFQSNLFVVSSVIISNTATTVTTASDLGPTAFNSRWIIAHGEHGDSSILNKTLYFPAGQYILGNDTWVIRNLRSGLIKGAGRLVSEVRGYGDAVLQFDGLWYSCIEDMSFTQLNDASICALDMDGNANTGGYATRGVQSNTLKNLYIYGGYATYAMAVCRQGVHGGQGSENLYLNCFFAAASEACYFQNGFNALANSFIGGNFQDYYKHGAYIVPGTAGFWNTGFQSTHLYDQFINNGWDISINVLGGAYEGSPIIGCRTESPWFLQTGSTHVYVAGCIGASVISGWFAGTAYDTAVSGREWVKVTSSVDGVPMLMVATTPGTSGVSEPDWNVLTNSGDTVNDNGIVWTECSGAHPDGRRFIFMDATLGTVDLGSSGGRDGGAIICSNLTGAILGIDDTTPIANTVPNPSYMGVFVGGTPLLADDVTVNAPSVRRGGNYFGGRTWWVGRAKDEAFDVTVNFQDLGIRLKRQGLSTLTYPRLPGSATFVIREISADGYGGWVLQSSTYLSHMTADFITDLNGNEIVGFTQVSTEADNYVNITNADTTTAPMIEAAGSDTNIDLLLGGKGTGVVKFGTHTGSADVAISGYITIKDAAGNTRKLAVIT